MFGGNWAGSWTGRWHGFVTDTPPVDPPPAWVPAYGGGGGGGSNDSSNWNARNRDDTQDEAFSIYEQNDVIIQILAAFVSTGELQ